MSEGNWYDEGSGSCSFHEKTMKAYNAYQPPSIESILKPMYVVGICDDCDWSGDAVEICPKCGKDNITWLTQEEMDSYKDI